MTDKKELKLQSEYEVAGQLLADATKAATRAAQAKVRARRSFLRAQYNLTRYRETRDAGKRPQ
jgi:hypothetical protein